MRTTEINEALKFTISVKRLGKYLSAMAGDLDAALKLYEENTRLSEAFYTPLQCLEVALRNTLNSRMCAAYGDDWPINARAPLEQGSRRAIEEAISSLQKDGLQWDTDALVAELNFGFWVGLLGKPYDATLWRKTLFKGFQGARGKKRSEVHGRFNALRRFRNRVAHHEPIFHRPLEQLHTEIIEAIGWMCRHTSAWAMFHSRFEAVITAPAN